MGFLEVWYDLIDERKILAAAPPRLRKLAQATFAKARARGHIRALDRLTEEVNGEHRIVEDVPLIVRAKHLPNRLERIGDALQVCACGQAAICQNILVRLRGQRTMMWRLEYS
jgi:hypothetical protein